MVQAKQAPEQKVNVKSSGKDLSTLQGLPIIGNQPKSSKEEEYLRELQEYEFHNLEEAGMMLTFSYGCRGKMHRFKFMHGAKYVVPRFIARHVESKGAPIWKWIPDGTGSMQKELIGKNQRFRMSPTFGE